MTYRVEQFDIDGKWYVVEVRGLVLCGPYRREAEARAALDGVSAALDRADARREAAADEAEARDREIEDDYAHEADYPHHAMNDRLDMGRNDAGEWLGFM